MFKSAEETYDPRSEVDEGNLEMLTSMWFAELHSLRALVTTRHSTTNRERSHAASPCSGNVEQVMEYLLQHIGDPLLDAPLTPPPKPIKSKRGGGFQPDPAVCLLRSWILLRVSLSLRGLRT
jgi:uncharacterized UBP type Zn finger protein